MKKELFLLEKYKRLYVHFSRLNINDFNFSCVPRVCVSVPREQYNKHQIHVPVEQSFYMEMAMQTHELNENI